MEYGILLNCGMFWFLLLALNDHQNYSITQDKRIVSVDVLVLGFRRGAENSTLGNTAGLHPWRLLEHVYAPLLFSLLCPALSGRKTHPTLAVPTLNQILATALLHSQRIDSPFSNHSVPKST